MAGTGGFFGALIYYLGKPDLEEVSDIVSKNILTPVTFLILSACFFRIRWAILKELGKR